MARKKRIAVLTAGGDAPGLNAVLRAVVKTARNEHGWEVYGVKLGAEGLVQPRGRGLKRLKRTDISGLIGRGGTILGANNRFDIFDVKPGQLVVSGKNLTGDQSDRAIRTLERFGISALITVGGDGTQTMARQLSEKGVSVVGVPKTIDNDLMGTDRTFGFDSAVAVVTEAIDRLYTTAESHHRVMLVEVMGRDSGFIALHSGVAGGAEVILIPEIPYDPDRVADVVQSRARKRRPFSIIVVSEGAQRAQGTKTYRDGEEGERQRLGGVSAVIQGELEQLTHLQVRRVVLGHTQRGGSPTAFDRVLATSMGSHAVSMIAEGAFGRMVALKGQSIRSVPLEQATRKVRKVGRNAQLVRIAREMGISFAAADGSDDAYTRTRRRYGAS